MESGTVERTPAGQPAALSATTLCEAFQATAAERADAVALRTPGDGVSVTWAEYAQRAARIAGGLAALGVERGDTVALMLTNRPEFNVADTGAMHLGATAFSVYNTSTPEQIEFLFGNAAQPRRDHRAGVPAGGARGAGALARASSTSCWSTARGRDGGARPARGDGRFRASTSTPTWRAVEPDDVLTLIYTSGTTGPPKGCSSRTAT